MVQPGVGGLDTPRTNIGDATYLSRQPDFDISQEVSFQSPSKDANLLQQLRNGGRPNLRTPRGGNPSSRAPFTDRRNLPAGLGGAEFTPLLKSATRNTARQYGVNGKENGALATPAFLARIDEDMTPMPVGETSVYGASRTASSYMEATPLPADTSSVASTPMVMRRRGGNEGDGAKGPLEDGNQLSLREQENVIDRIEKENFGLKLKIHFLEEALRKAGPGFSEAALKENTELKVDKVTMQRELQRYKKHLTSAEKDLESYRVQILEMQEKAKRKFADESQKAEMERMRRELEEKEADIEHLQRQLESDQDVHDKVEKLQDEISDLEAGIRNKDRIITEHEDQADELRDKVAEAEKKLKDTQRRMIELEEKAQSGERLQEAKESVEDRLREAKDTIQDLEADVRRLENQVDDMKDKLQDAISEKDRAEADLEELQEEMANKSVVTKGLSRQVEGKVSRLQAELDKTKQDFASLEEANDVQRKEVEEAKTKLREARRERDDSDRIRLALESRLDEAQADLNRRSDEKALLQTRHDALTNESTNLQREVAKLKKNVTELEEGLQQERQHSLDIENDIRNQYKNVIDRLNDEISDLQAECREKDNLYDNDSEKWETERHNLESERDRAEERAAGLQRTIDKLRDVEGALSSKESKLQDALQSEAERHKSEEAVLSRQIEDLQQNLDSRQAMLEDLRKELSSVRDQLRQSQLDCQSQSQKVEALEDEVEVLQATIDEESEKAQLELQRSRQESDKIRQELRQKQQEADKVRLELERSRQECESLKDQVASLETVAASARAMTTTNQESAKNTNESIARLKFQLADSAENLARVTKERQALQDRFSDLDIQTHSLRAKLTEAEAERDELEAEIRRLKQRGEDGHKFDQERLDLRTTKVKLEAELRRLQEANRAEREELEEEIRHLQLRGGEDTFKLDQERLDLRTVKARLDTQLRILREENRVLTEQRREVEQSLESEMEKASAEEERLNQEILELKAKLRQSFDSQELSTARRTIRELERRIDDYETRLATTQLPSQVLEGNSELSVLHRDLSAARQKELELLRHEASQKETIKALKRQIADLERKVHEAALDRLVTSPSSHGGSAQKAEIVELRHQLSTAHQSAHALKKSLREAEQKAAATARELQARLDEIEEQKLTLENALDDAQLAAEESAAAHDQALKKYKHKLDKYKRERDELAVAVREQQHQLGNNGNHTGVSDMPSDERRDLHNMLRESQMAADKLDREVREQREALDELMGVEMALRKKLDRARSERAAYRASAEKLQKDVKALRVEKDKAVAEAVTAKEKEDKERALVPISGSRGIDTDAIIRAAEAAERRHEKEIRGMVMQMEWLKACWDREAKLRSDAAFAKRYLLLEVAVRDACNKADLAIINRIRAELNPAAPGRSALTQLSSVRERQKEKHTALQQGKPLAKLRGALHAVRFVVRMQMGAQRWAKHEKIRQRLANCVEEMEREERIKRMRDIWRAQQQQTSTGARGERVIEG